MEGHHVSLDANQVDVVRRALEAILGAMQPFLAAVVGLDRSGGSVSAHHDVVKAEPDLLGSERRHEVIREEKKHREVVPTITQEGA